MLERLIVVLALAGVPAAAVAGPPAPDGHAPFGAAGRAAQVAGPVVDHASVDAFRSLGPDDIAAAAALRVLFVDHSVGENINQGLNCYASASVAAAPSFCKRFAHVDPALSADPAWFVFGPQYDRARWVYHAGAPSYWREWPAHLATLLRERPDWDVVIMMPSYLVAPNGGWQPYEDLEAAHPGIRFVLATSSLPRGAAGGTPSDLRMQAFNADARAYALAHGKPFLDVADILSHDYRGGACFDTRDGKPYCRDANACEDLPDDGVDIPAICQHYTSELYGGHLGNVSGGMLRMAQAMWLLMARLAADRPGEEPTPTTDPATATVSPTATVSAAATATAAATPSPAATIATPTPSPAAPVLGAMAWLPWLNNGAAAGLGRGQGVSGGPQQPGGWMARHSLTAASAPRVGASR